MSEPYWFWHPTYLPKEYSGNDRQWYALEHPIDEIPEEEFEVSPELIEFIEQFRRK